MGRPFGFEYQTRKNGDLIIRRHGRPILTLSGARTDRILADVELRDDQEVMARVTGNYKRGNERRRS